MAGKKDSGIDLAEAFRMLAEKVTIQAHEPNILAYVPHSKQEFFHQGEDYLRLYIGGNRSGKTFGAVVEDIWWCTHTHPYIKTPPGKIRGRVVAVDIERGVNEILLPIFQRLLTGTTFLINGSWEDSWRASSNKLTFANGSTIEFMSYEQSIEKFAGTSRHFIHYDEPPPQGIYEECQARLVDTKGRAWISMTPVDGSPWIFDVLYEPVNDAADKEELNVFTSDIAPVYRSRSKKTLVVEVGMNENPHLDAEARETYLAGLSEDQRKARSKGTFITAGGKVFPHFSLTKHVTNDMIIARDLQLQGWQIYTSTDHGWNSPSAWLWHAVAPDSLGGVIITFGEIYQNHTTIEEYSRLVILKEEAWGLDREQIVRTGDPAMNQHSAVSGTTIIQEYARHGLYIGTEGVPTGPGSANIGMAKMQQYFKLRGAAERPMWTIHSSCINFIKELKALKFKTYSSRKMRDENNAKEEVHKHNDHAYDSAKYFATFLPDLSPDDVPLDLSGLEKKAGLLTYDTAILRMIEERENQGTSGWTTLESYN